MRTIRSTTRAILAEFKVAPKNWDLLTSSVMTVLNSTVLPRLGQRTDGISKSPLEVMTGISPTRKVLHVFPPDVPSTVYHCLRRARAACIASIDDLKNALEHMYRDVGRTDRLRRKTSIAEHTSATSIVAISIGIGDFVLVYRAIDRAR